MADIKLPADVTSFSPAHRGWYSRGYLPHCDYPELLQSMTFRLADSVPTDVIVRWKEELDLLRSVTASPADSHSSISIEARETELYQRIARYEDAGQGACWLRDERIAQVVEDTLLLFDGQRYRLLAWCVMPNHVHALIGTFNEHPLSAVAHSWKSFTAHEANRILGRQGSFWMRDYHDRFIRNERHLAAAIAYIENNPVKAALTQRPEDWRFSSAARRAQASE